MSSHTVSKTHSQIFNYWKDKCISNMGDVAIEIGYEGYNESTTDVNNTIPVVEDWGEPCCWGCGIWTGVAIEETEEDEDDDLSDIIRLWNNRTVKHYLERAHIVPNALGGEDCPSNLFLLCKRCHRDSPDTTYPREFFKWIYKRRKEGNIFYRSLVAASKECIQEDIAPIYINPNKAKKEMGIHAGFHAESSYVSAMVGQAREYMQMSANALLKEFEDEDMEEDK